MMYLTVTWDTGIEERDDALIWAILHERGLRELRYRAENGGEVVGVRQVSLSEVVPACDAGDVCHVCGEVVTWTDHLPPLGPGETVRCLKNVEHLPDRQHSVKV